MYYNTQVSCLKRKWDTIKTIVAIQAYLEARSEANISQVSRDLGINRRTAAKCLELIKFIHSRFSIYERSGKRGARVFSVWNKKTAYKFKYKDSLKMVYERLSKNEFENIIASVLNEMFRIGNSLELPKKVLERAFYLYRDLTTDAFRRRAITARILVEDMLPAVIYLVCQECKLDLTFDEVAQISYVPKERIERIYGFLEKALQGGGQIVPGGPLLRIAKKPSDIRMRKEKDETSKD